MAVFTGTDRVQHFFWDDLEQLIRDKDQGSQSKDDDVCGEVRDYFRELDEAIATLVDAAGPSADLFLISDHGFGPAQTRRFYVNVWLEKLGLLQRRRSKGAFDLEHLRVQIGRHRRLKALLRHLLPERTQQNVRTITETISGEIIEWSGTRAYFVPIYFHVCGIEINSVGHRREGIVPAGPEYEALRDLIIDAALQLSDPEDGRRIVEIAARREDLFSGPHVHQFPDLILVLNPDYLGIWSVAGSSLTESHRALRPGEHRQDGVFVGAGPTLGRQGELDGLRLLDIPATIMYALGLPVPASFDGRVLQEIFAPEYLSTHPVLIAEPPEPMQEPDLALITPDEGYTEEEEAALAERLRGLGYLD
jgi:predicted AlkP superfamily phosphohydrolase/phosphomutase